MKPSDGSTQELLIIRRGGADDGMAVKGGAWKIAYADFVTAMMAFFLVMWLINSANEVTKARVASYFNPIKMTDAAPARRGLKETTDAQSPNVRVEEEGGAAKVGVANTTKDPAQTANSAITDEVLLMNPYAMLDELIRRADSDRISGASTVEVADASDPFNPHAFKNLRELSPPEAKSEVLNKVPIGEIKDEQMVGTAERAVKTPGKTQDPNSEAPSDDMPEGDKQSTASEQSDAAAAGMHSKQRYEPSEVDKQLAMELRERIEARREGTQDKLDVKIQVEATPDGLLIVLEDGKGKSMFAIGSAQPNPVLIEIVGEIGQVLAETARGVVIRGHTDGRQFRNRKYDNWQLSTDRAHMASYMLIRGGMSESQVSRIEGYGSSKPVKEGDYMLDANRRVEFLLVK